MPNARGEILTSDARRMLKLRPTNSLREIAFEIGCCHHTVWRHLNGLPRERESLLGVRAARRAIERRAERYDAFVRSVSGFVPTFGASSA